MNWSWWRWTNLRSLPAFVDAVRGRKGPRGGEKDRRAVTADSSGKEYPAAYIADAAGFFVSDTETLLKGGKLFAARILLRDIFDLEEKPAILISLALRGDVFGRFAASVGFCAFYFRIIGRFLGLFCTFVPDYA